MKKRAEFHEATYDDLEEMLELLEAKPSLWQYVDFLLDWTEGKENVSGHESVLNWMRYYSTFNE